MGSSAASPAQVISLPKGGGAIAGIGETFSPDLHTGTGNFSVPIMLPPGRNGFQPSLTLGYSTGSGNGPFGLGWALGVPSISRKTSRGIPRYDDTRDTFLLSGAEDLVPVSTAEGVTAYRPRTEGMFARITQHTASGVDYWRVAGKDGMVSTYGLTTPGATGASVVSPSGGVFAWKLTRTTDPFGNTIEYTWERDENRSDGSHAWDQLYLAAIRYADHGDPANPQFLISVRFDYDARPDPFSDYRAGFEVRTVRRCTRIRVATHPSVETPVRTYHLTYLDQRPELADSLPGNGASLLSLVETIGHDGATNQALPPLEFTYSRFEPGARRLDMLRAPKGAMPPAALGNPDVELVDLFGNGLPSVIQMNGVARTWRNRGDGSLDPPRTMATVPAGIHLADPGVQLIDADGDGRTDLLVADGSRAGYFPLTHEGTWDDDGYVAWRAAPSVSLDDPAVRMVDLDGDGITDALRTGIALELFFNDGREGWTRIEARTRRGLDVFPNVTFTDPRVKLADMNGDGLQDIVLVNDGRIDYWPSLGHGRWGHRIMMRRSPRFREGGPAAGTGYDPKRLLLADIDGDGVADAVYVGWGIVTVWLGQSGNGWSDPITIHGTSAITGLDSVRVADMHGTGTPGILWTFDAGVQRESAWKFLDLTGGVKPYLLVAMNNHRGAVTRVAYESSVRQHLRDEADPDTRWRTTLPFPVQVVSRVEVIDEVSGGKLTTEYRYHQGYWDGVEREFRGFGMVEQLDTESFAAYGAPGLHGADQAFVPVPQRSFALPTLVRTWFHQGPVGSEGDWSASILAGVPWAGDPTALPEDASTASLLANLPPRARRDAIRSLRGRPLRTELYALDGTTQAAIPHSVTEFRYGLREVTAPGTGDSGRRRIFFPYHAGKRTTEWERGQDPLTRVDCTADFDAYGQPRTQVSIAVPRRRNYRQVAAPGPPYLVTQTRTDFAVQPSPTAGRFIADRVARTTSFEIVNDGSQSLADLIASILAGDVGRELIGQALTWYDGDAFTGLPLGQVGAYGAPVRTEALVHTDATMPAALGDMPGGGVPPYLIAEEGWAWPAEYPAAFRDTLAPRAGFVLRQLDDGLGAGWFSATSRRRYDVHGAAAGERTYGLVREQRDAIDNASTMTHDPYRILPITVTDAAGLVTTAEVDYRVLVPRALTDPNGARTVVRFTPLGMVASVAVIGPNGEGDTEAAPGTRFTYDLDAFRSRRQPASARTDRRVHHVTDTGVPAEIRDETITSVEYSDGYGRLLQTRAQAEDLVFGDSVLGSSGLPLDQALPGVDVVGQQLASGASRVVVSGWQVYDNKGRVVEKSEPWFASEFAHTAPSAALLAHLQRVTTDYDPQGRPQRTVYPDGSEQRIVHGVPGTLAAPDLANPDIFAPSPWETFAYDANDNAGRTHPGESAAWMAHWNTPVSTMIDALGRTVRSTERNGPNPATDALTTHTTYDIQGNVLEVIDPLGRVAVANAWDLLQQALRTVAIDAGTSWTVRDAAGRVIEQRDARGALVLHAYDALGRLTQLWARDAAGDAVRLRERHVYGDDAAADQLAARAACRLGKAWRQYDEAGLLTCERYDFKGNLLEKTRRVISDAAILTAFADAAANDWRIEPFRVDWTPAAGERLEDRAASLLDAEVFTSQTSYDGLNRVQELRYPTDTGGQRRIARPAYNRGGNLERVMLAGSPAETLRVDQIAYNAKGQRLLVVYGNGVMTRHAYDLRTGRLARTRSDRYTIPVPNTYRPAGQPLQDYGYAYDLAGNLVAIRDRTPGGGIGISSGGATSSISSLGLPDDAGGIIAPPAVEDDGEVAPPPPGDAPVVVATLDALDRLFTYDPLYRLVAATGRECEAPPPPPPWTNQPRCRDVTRAVAYSETYQYDAVGNLRRLQHGGANPGYTRLLTTEVASNRLAMVSVGTDTWAYEWDAGGNLVQEGTSRHFAWDHADRLRTFRVQVRAAGSSPTDDAWSESSIYAHYLYDASGQRVKKLVRKQGGGIETAIWIDGGFEVRRIVRAGGTTEHRTLHLMDGVKRIALLRTGPAFTGDPRPAATFELADHLGGSNVVLDGAGVLLDREEYTPWGETSYGSAPFKRYRFCGKERDEESSLGYHGARYYAPWLCRWTSADPAGMVDGPNLFAYCRNGPLRLADLTGLQGDEASFASLNPTIAEISQSKPLTDQLDRSTIPIPAASSALDYAKEAKTGRDAYRAANSMLPGTQAQHWTKEITSGSTSMPSSTMNQNMSPLQSRNALPATTMLSDPGGGGTRYNVQGGSTFGNEHKFADRYLIPAEEARTKSGMSPRNAAVDAGRTARWIMTGDPGPDPNPAPPPAATPAPASAPATPAAPAGSKSPATTLSPSAPASPGIGKSLMGSAKTFVKSFIPGADLYDELKVAGGGSALMGLRVGLAYTWAQAGAVATRVGTALAPVAEGAAAIGSRLTAPFIIIVDPRLTNPELFGNNPYGPPNMT